MPERIIICGKPDEARRVLSLLQFANANTSFIGFVNTDAETRCEGEDARFALGSIHQLTEIIDVYGVNEIIFCGRDVASHIIIDHMLASGNKPVEFKIAPPESIYIIGSNSINDHGDLYLVDMNVVNNAVNRRNKRMYDIASSFLLLFLFPLSIFTVKKKAGLLDNIFSVLAGKKSWVGLATGGQSAVPSTMKPGVLNPQDALNGIALDHATIERLNLLYARDYKIQHDMHIMWKGRQWLGGKA